MFAGIVECVGSVVRLADRGPAARLEIEMPELLDGLALGASVAVNGACLTLAEVRGGAAGFDVVPETLRLTNLGGLRPGDSVNLERSLRVGDRIDGHFVQGHVDGVGRVNENSATSGEWRLVVAAPADLLPFIVRKGSITIDGVSLTIADVTPDRFSVALIPTTLERTTLGRRRPGDKLNLETDILARLVISRLDETVGQVDPGAPGLPGQHGWRIAAGLADSTCPTPITLDRLREAGFLT